MTNRIDIATNLIENTTATRMGRMDLADACDIARASANRRYLAACGAGQVADAIKIASTWSRRDTNGLWSQAWASKANGLRKHYGI